MAPSKVHTPQSAWIHKIFLIEGTLKQLLISNSQDLKRIISKETLIKSNKKDYYGWGDSLKVPENKTDWIDGCIIAQYYYFSLDRFNRKLPEMILSFESTGNLVELGRSELLAQDLLSRISAKEIAYRDLLHYVAGNTRKSIEGYNDSWRVQGLRESLASKVPVIRSIIADIQERRRRISNSIIESILVFVSLLGLISLFLGVHDHITKQSHHSIEFSDIIVSMAPKSFSHTLPAATGIALTGMGIFILVRSRILFSILQFLKIKIKKYFARRN